MTQVPVYKKSARNFKSNPALNSSGNDFYTKDGARISLCLYVDQPHDLRKTQFSELRRLASQMTTTEVKSASGISVSSNTSQNLDRIESYLGITLDTLRSAVLFQRGGIPLDLCLKIQEVTGIVWVSDKDLTTAFKTKLDRVKSYISEYPFEETDGV